MWGCRGDSSGEGGRRCPPASPSSLGVSVCVVCGDGDGGMEGTFPSEGALSPASLGTAGGPQGAVPLGPSSPGCCWALGTRASLPWRSIPGDGPALFPGLLPSTWGFSGRERNLVPTWAHRLGLGEPARTRLSEAELMAALERGWVTAGGARLETGVPLAAGAGLASRNH